MVGWLLAGWLSGWLAGLLAGLLAGWLACWLAAAVVAFPQAERSKGHPACAPTPVHVQSIGSEGCCVPPFSMTLPCRDFFGGYIYVW